jgi:hypothetical protein
MHKLQHACIKGALLDGLPSAGMMANAADMQSCISLAAHCRGRHRAFTFKEFFPP